MVGSANASGTPEAVSEGPIPRTITFRGAVPVMMNPPIIALSPGSTRPRVEILSPAGGVVDGVGVGVGVGMGVGDGVGVEAGVGVTVGVGVGVAVAIGEAVGVGVGVTVGVGVGVAVGVGVGGASSSVIVPVPSALEMMALLGLLR